MCNYIVSAVASSAPRSLAEQKKGTMRAVVSAKTLSLYVKRASLVVALMVVCLRAPLYCTYIVNVQRRATTAAAPIFRVAGIVALLPVHDARRGAFRKRSLVGGTHARAHT